MKTTQSKSPLPEGEGSGEGRPGPGPSAAGQTTLPPIQKHSPQTTFYRTAYGPRLRLSISFPAAGRTKQEFKNECDINSIMSRFDKTGVLAFTNRFEPQYGDVTGIEFQSAMETIAHGRSMFLELPSGIRSRFRNDPALFLDFVHDEKNVEEMREMGLLRPRDAKATPLPGASGEAHGGALPSSLEDSNKGGSPSELDRGTSSTGPAKSPRSGEKPA